MVHVFWTPSFLDLSVGLSLSVWTQNRLCFLPFNYVELIQLSLPCLHIGTQLVSGVPGTHVTLLTDSGVCSLKDLIHILYSILNIICSLHSILIGQTVIVIMLRHVKLRLKAAGNWPT